MKDMLKLNPNGVGQNDIVQAINSLIENVNILGDIIFGEDVEEDVNDIEDIEDVVVVVEDIEDIEELIKLRKELAGLNVIFTDEMSKEQLQELVAQSKLTEGGKKNAKAK